MGIESNNKILQDLGNVHPAFAKHTMIKNEVVKLFALKRYGTIDLLDQPMCTKCEKPATWHKGGTAYHLACGTFIQHPITMLEYLRNEIKLSPEILDLLGAKFYGDEIITDAKGIILK